MKLPYERSRTKDSSKDTNAVCRRESAKRSFLYAAGCSAYENPVASLQRSKQEDHSRYESSACQNEIGRQLEFIWREASDCGLVLNYEGLNVWSSDFEQEAGAEHLAVLIPEEGRVYKRTLGSLQGEMFGVEKLPIPYLLNQALISYFFRTESLFEGISRRPGETTTEFLISQRYIRAADPENPYPNLSQLIQFFEAHDFEFQEDDFGVPRFVNKELGLGIKDAHPGNFIVEEEGVKPFDIHFEITRSESVAAITEILSSTAG